MMRLKDPRNQRQAERSIKKAQTEFMGMLSGTPAREIDNRHSALNINVIDQGKYAWIRSGSRLYTATAFPMGYGGILAMNTVICKCWHEKAGLIVWLLWNPVANDDAGAAEVWISNTAMTAWTQAMWVHDTNPYFKPAMSDPTKVTMCVEGDHVIISSEEEGIFRVVISRVENSAYIHSVYRINLPLAFAQIENIPQEVGTLDYGYRFLLSLMKIVEPAVNPYYQEMPSDHGNRVKDGHKIEWESGTAIISADTDYCERYYETPIANDGVDRSFPVVMTTDWKHPTHYGFYRTKDIGPNGISPTIDGLGNRPDLVVWEEDVRAVVVVTLYLGEEEQQAGGVRFNICWGKITEYELFSTLHIFTSAAGVFTASREIQTLNYNTWRARAAAAANWWNCVCWSPDLGLFCAVSLDGAGANRVMTSPDGINWTIQAASAANQWGSVCWSPGLGLFCAVSHDGANRVMTSINGIAWNGHLAAALNTWMAICWSEDLGLFCAVSLDGVDRVMTSPDGTNWTGQTAAEANQWRGICWSPELGIFCAVSLDGNNRVMTSTNGINWIAQQASEPNQWLSVCWSPELGLFCAVADTGTNVVMTSPDGINWTSRVAPTNGMWGSVCWSPGLGLFCAVGVSGTGRVMVSPDGINWTLQTAASLDGWGSVCWSPYLGLFCSVSFNAPGNRVMTHAHEVTVNGANIATNQYDAYLGMAYGTNLCRATLNADTLAFVYGSAAAAPIYEGTLIQETSDRRLLVENVTGAGVVTVKQDATPAWPESRAMLVLKRGIYQRRINPIMIDDPDGTNVLSLQDRVDSGSDVYIPRRFFKPLPNCGLGSVDSGFGVFANRELVNYYHSQAGDKPYSLGYYVQGVQERDLNGPVQGMVQFPSVTLITLKNQTILISLANSNNVGRQDVGENIFQIKEPIVADDKIGVTAWWSMRFVGNQMIAVTSEPAVRFFNGNSWQPVNVALDSGTGDDAVMREYINKIMLSYGGISLYNPLSGYKIWFYRAEEGQQGPCPVRRCLRYATQFTEGLGWTDCRGDDWVDPEDYVGDLVIRDANGTPRTLVIVNIAGVLYVYEIDTYDRFTFLVPPATDLQTIGGAGGTEVAWEKHGREETASATDEDKNMAHDVSHIYVSPSDPANRDAAGYTASGLRNGLQIGLEDFVDGEKTVPRAQTTNIPENGDIIFMGNRVEARRHQMVVTGTAGEVFITGKTDEYIVLPKAGTRTERQMTEATLAAELATGLVYWINRERGDPLYERIRGSAIAGNVTAANGPDGRANSGFTANAALQLLNPAVPTNYTIILWSTVAAPIAGVGLFNLFAAQLGWSLLYASGAAGIPANLVGVIGSGFFDVRIYNKQLTAAAIAIMHDDMVRNQGRAYLGW